MGERGGVRWGLQGIQNGRRIGFVPNEAPAWRSAGLIDTLSHVHRLDLPVHTLREHDTVIAPACIPLF